MKKKHRNFFFEAAVFFGVFFERKAAELGLCPALQMAEGVVEPEAVICYNLCDTGNEKWYCQKGLFDIFNKEPSGIAFDNAEYRPLSLPWGYKG